MIYWLTTIKSQIAKKNSNKTRKTIFIAKTKTMVKKISVSNHNENDKKSWKGIFLKVHFWQIGTINIF